jgi:hypothetical protein
VTTEWDEFKQYDYEKLRQQMKPGVSSMYDLRCYIEPEKMAAFDRVF